MIVYERLSELALKHPQATMIYGVTSYSYGHMMKTVDRVARHLREIGLGQSSTGIVVSSSYDHLVLMIALSSLRTAVLLLDQGSSQQDADHLLRRCRPRYLLTGSQTAEHWSIEAQQLDRLHCIEQDVAVFDLSPIGCGNYNSVLQRDPDGDLYFATSGSSAEARVVARPQESVAADADNIGATIELHSSDRVLCLVPPSHAYGFGWGCLAPALSGASVTLTNPFILSGMLRAMLSASEYNVLIAAPWHYNLLAEAERSFDHSLRLAVSAGAHLAPGVAKAFRRRLGLEISNAYGMTEVGAIAVQIFDTPNRDPMSVGRPLHNVEVRSSLPSESSAAGADEIMVKSSALARGYVLPGSQEVGWPTGRIEHDLWFRTGDLGLIDQHGCLSITGRLDSVINVAGRKVAPAEIEGCLLLHQSVIEAAVVPRHDQKRGQVPIAYVVLREHVDVQELFSLCRTRLSSYKIPRKIYIQDELPKSATGKILKTQLNP